MELLRCRAEPNTAEHTLSKKLVMGSSNVPLPLIGNFFTLVTIP
jgi:hypothetical protein